MLAVTPDMISKIDAYAKEVLKIPTSLLMERAGAAVANAVTRYVRRDGARILILCGGGNNGGDGYAAGALLLEYGYEVRAVDVFAQGVRTEEANAALRRYKETPCAVLSCGLEGIEDELSTADCVVEAVFGAGARGDYPTVVNELIEKLRLARLTRGKQAPVYIAVDCPIGIDAYGGRAYENALSFDATVELSFPKIGTHSYPARRYAGELILDTLGLPTDEIAAAMGITDRVIDASFAASLLPVRDPEGHKGSFGALGAIVGSREYPGAALLACAGALRSGIGMLRFFGEREVKWLLLNNSPEAVTCEIAPVGSMTLAEAERFVRTVTEPNAWLIGCGAGKSEGLANLLAAFLSSDGAPLVLDADALNVISEERERLLPLLSKCKRKITMTPHPMELARLMNKNVAEIQKERVLSAKDFAKEYGVTLLLKGCGSVIASPSGKILLNESGNTALSKGGSGDVLAGVIASYTAQGLSGDDACALGAYLHGKAAEKLSEQYGEAGVLPSDLPLEIARVACNLKRG